MYRYIFTWIQNEKGVFLTCRRVLKEMETIEVNNIIKESNTTKTFAILKMIVSQFDNRDMIEPKIVEYINDYFKWEQPKELEYNINYKNDLWAVNLSKIGKDNIKEEEEEV